MSIFVSLANIDDTNFCSIIFLICFLLALHARCSESASISVEAFDSNGNSLGLAPPQNETVWEFAYNSSFNPNAEYYLVGDGKRVLEFWTPFQCPGGGDMIALQIAIAKEMVQDHGKQGARDKIQAKILCAGWGGVVGNEICTDGKPCPGLILIGTTQLHSRIEEGNVLSLNSFMSDYTAAHGEVLSDDFIKYYFYDFNLNGEWYAVPLVSDTRVLLFNTTTFDNLGLRHPPPFDLAGWGTPYSSTWNWEKFTEYAVEIKNKTGNDGWTLHTCWDEEIKISMMIGNNFKSQLYKDGAKGIHLCALGSNFADGMQKTLGAMFAANAIGPASGTALLSGSDFLSWMKDSPAANPVNSIPSLPPFCCQCFDSSNIQINGMDIEPPGVLSSLPSDIKMAYVPGRFSFLGGSGLLITSKSTESQQILAWDFLTRLVGRISDHAVIVQSPPPLESFWEQVPWNGPVWAPTLAQLKASVPAQYPLPSFPQFGMFETYKPFRMMWLEMQKKNVAAQTAVSRACEIINYLFTPNCSETHNTDPSCNICTFADYSYSISKCDSHLNRLVSFQKLSACVGGVHTPSSFNTPCDFVPTTSAVGKAARTISHAGITICFLFGIFIVVKRSSPVIKVAQPIFCFFFCLGAALMNIYPLLLLGENSTSTCIARQWIIVLSSPLMIDSLFLKIHKVHKLFLNKQLKKMKIKTSLLLSRLGVLLLVDIFVLLLWAGVDPIRQNIQMTQKSRSISASDDDKIFIPHKTCLLNNKFIFAIWTWKAAVVAYGCCLSWQTRNIQEKFSEGKHVLLAIYNIAFVGLVAALLMFGVGISEGQAALVQALVVLCCSVTSVAFVMIPKVFNVTMDRPSIFPTGSKSSCAGQIVHALQRSSLEPVQGHELTELREEIKILKCKIQQLAQESKEMDGDEFTSSRQKSFPGKSRTMTLKNGSSVLFCQIKSQ